MTVGEPIYTIHEEITIRIRIEVFIIDKGGITDHDDL
jgi:hypothetical protein